MKNKSYENSVSVGIMSKPIKGPHERSIAFDTRIPGSKFVHDDITFIGSKLPTIRNQ